MRITNFFLSFSSHQLKNARAASEAGVVLGRLGKQFIVIEWNGRIQFNVIETKPSDRRHINTNCDCLIWCEPFSQEFLMLSSLHIFVFRANINDDRVHFATNFHVAFVVHSANYYLLLLLLATHITVVLFYSLFASSTLHAPRQRSTFSFELVNFVHFSFQM